MSLRTLLPWALVLCACSQASEKKPSPRLPAQSLFLNEPFQLAGKESATCRVTQAKPALLESAALPNREARVRPDVRALEIVLRCEGARGEPIDSRRALPDDSVVMLTLQGGKSLAMRPEAIGKDRDALVFELPEGAVLELPTPRRFDADSGASVLTRESAVAKLSLRTTSRAFEISLRQRFHDASLDRLLDSLAVALASDASPLALAAQDAQALLELRAIYRDVQRRFRPARLELTRLSAGTPERITLTLSLTRPRNHARAFEVARFELTLARAADGTLQLVSFDNRDAARAALTCDAMHEDMQRALHASPPDKRGQTCNALGLLLPSACADVAPALLARALEVGARCTTPFSAAPTSKKPLPGDFQLTLRRGRTASGLDKNPRYVVALFHGGQVVFHGKHWVATQERSDGRTDLLLLAGLYEHVRALDFFARRGGEYDFDHCSPTEDQGDVITVIAGDKQRMVLNRDGCRGPFSEAELTELRRHVEHVAGIAAWTTEGGSFTDEDAEQWAIAE